MIVPTDEEDKDREAVTIINDDKKHRFKKYATEWMKKQEEDLPDIKDVKTWLFFQLKTFNWGNFGVVVILLYSLQTVQYQSHQNSTDIKFVAESIGTVNIQLTKSQSLLLRMQSDIDYVTTTSRNISSVNTEFHYKAKIATKNVEDLTAEFYDNAMIVTKNLQNLNSSASSLYYHAKSMLMKPKKIYVLDSGSQFTPSTNPAPLYLIVKMVGGGSGGAAAGESVSGISNGSPATSTIFGNSLVVACGSGANNGVCVSSRSGLAGFAAYGGYGIPYSHFPKSVGNAGAPGSPSFFGGFPAWGTGGPGGGLYQNPGGECSLVGGSGGAGDYVEVMITDISNKYTYVIGKGGKGGIAVKTSCNGQAAYNGESGKDGVIIVEEHFS